MAREQVGAEVVWEDPPPENRGGGVNHRVVAAALKSNPGAWGRIGEYRTAASAGSMAQAVRNANLSAYEPAGSFEGVSRKIGNRYYVYAQYVGEPDA